MQVDGPGELLRYLMIHISISPTAFAPSGAGARILHWSTAQQREKDMEMMGMAEVTRGLPDIKLEGYEFLFTEELHKLPETDDSAQLQADGSSQWFTPSSQWFTPSSQWFTPSSQWSSPSSQWFTPLLIRGRWSSAERRSGCATRSR